MSKKAKAAAEREYNPDTPRAQEARKKGLLVRSKEQSYKIQLVRNLLKQRYGDPPYPPMAFEIAARDLGFTQTTWHNVGREYISRLTEDNAKTYFDWRKFKNVRNEKPEEKENATEISLKPQPGPQTEFLSSKADIVVFGSGAGCGKSFALLLDPLRYVKYPDFGAVIFRRTYPEIKNEGGLWDEATKMYLPLGAKPRETDLSFTFPSGAVISFAHLQYEKNIYNWQGAQIPYIGFDEGTHFCMTPEHEILTNNGWVRIDEIENDQKVLSIDKDGQSDFIQVKECVCFDYEGDLISVFSDHVSMCVTPNHKIPVKMDETWEFARADDLEKNTYELLCISDYIGGEEVRETELYSIDDKPFKVPTNLWLKFLGLYIANGECKADKYTIRLEYRPDDAYYLYNLLLGIDPSFRVANHNTFIAHSEKLYNVLCPIGNMNTRRIPRFIYGLPRRQIQIFFDSFISSFNQITNAYIEKGEIKAYNRDFINDLQELLVFLGYSSKIDIPRFMTFSLTVDRKNKTELITPDNVKRTPYKGKVYCITVPDNHTFLTRKDGRIHWTGNTERQIWYLMSRQRNVAGIPNLIRITCNPDPDCFLRKLIDWWIGPSGFPIPDRGGVLRWFVRDGATLRFADTEEKLKAKYPDLIPRSLTFIPARLTDNKILMEKSPEYLATLMSLPVVDRARLLEGNWNIRATSGLYFKRLYFEIVEKEALPPMRKVVRGWDLAGTAKREQNTAGEIVRRIDATSGIKMGLGSDGFYYIMDLIYGRFSPFEVENYVLQAAKADGVNTIVRLPQDPGQAGKAQIAHFAKKLAGFRYRSRIMTGDKVTRAGALSSAAEHGLVRVVRGEWNETLFEHLEAFPPQIGSPDVVDSAVEAFHELTDANINIARIIPISVKM